MAGSADLGGVAQTAGDARWIPIDGRTGDSKRCDGNEKFCRGADAVWAAVSGGRFSTYCSTDGSEGIEFGCGGRAGAGGGIERVLFERKAGVAGAIFGDLFAASVESAAVFMVDDVDAAQVSGG